MKVTSWFAVCALLVSALALGLGTASAAQYAGDVDTVEVGKDSQDSNIVTVGAEEEYDEEMDEDHEWDEEEEEEEEEFDEEEWEEDDEDDEL
ncbi:hypothetical protein [Aquisalimonas sp.]|uniref:hypothetical protein n=1 Tax=Aquisalimonas sp. TaxID=1872621 RepID=UPI0025BB5593|nr:hypothetical protein [Aquisalimonas sp.]